MNMIDIDYCILNFPQEQAQTMDGINSSENIYFNSCWKNVTDKTPIVRYRIQNTDKDTNTDTDIRSHTHPYMNAPYVPSLGRNWICILQS